MDGPKAEHIFKAKPNYNLNGEGTVVIECGASRDYRGRPFHVSSRCCPLNFPMTSLPQRWANIPPLPSSFARSYVSIKSATSITNAVFNGTDLTSALSGNRYARGALKWDIKRFESDPYGPENLYNGSCVAVKDDVLLHTANDGQLAANKLIGGPESFQKIESHSVIGEEERLSFTRIFGVNVGKGDNVGMVGARYRYGAAFFNLEEDMDGFPRLRKLYSLPSAKEAVEQTFLPGAKSAVLDSAGQLSVVDLNVCSVVARRGKLGLDVGKWRWGGVASAHHPRTLLVADRINVGLEDLREKGGGDFSKVFATGEIRQLIRGLNSIPPFAYLLTDETLILCDVRNRKRPIDAWQAALPAGTQASGMARERIGEKDWMCVWNRWGDVSVALLDWGHRGCGEWRGEVKVECGVEGGRRPDTVGMPVRLPGWREVVKRGRGLGGAWLDEGVEERAQVLFTGACLVPQEGGVAVVGVNGVGDLTEMRLGLGEEPFSINDDEEEEEEKWRKEEAWLEKWAEEVRMKKTLKGIDVTYRSARDKVVDEKEKVSKLPKKVGDALRKKLFAMDKGGKGLPFVLLGANLDFYCPWGEYYRSIGKIHNAKVLPNYNPRDKDKYTTRERHTRMYYRSVEKLAAKMNLSEWRTENNSKIRTDMLPGLHDWRWKRDGTPRTSEDFISRSILRILDGEGEGEAGNTAGEQGGLSRSQEAPTLPGEEDPDYTLRAFMEDLGVQM